jgi:AraC-like DNA-binding protein
VFHQYINKNLGSIIGLCNHYQKDASRFEIKESIVTILWNKNEDSVRLEIDKVPFEIEPNQILTLTYLQKIEFPTDSKPLHAIVFNREFYCILDHDEEVSCNGILFFGTQDIPIISLNEKELESFNLLLQVFIDEFETNDKVQGEMLQMLLKRFIIKCVRLAKEQLITKELDNKQIDVIRQYNFLVDIHFKEKRQVKDYAEILFKSPKTLSNLFGIYNQRSPQQIINDRMALEAKRLLHFTDKSINEVCFDLGFDDPAYFSRFFKKQTGSSPSDFKNTSLLPS